jgi:hypothetical protein
VSGTVYFPLPFFLGASFTSAPALFFVSFAFALEEDSAADGAGRSGKAANLAFVASVDAWTTYKTKPYPHEISIVVKSANTSMNFAPTDDFAPPSKPNFPCCSQYID